MQADFHAVGLLGTDLTASPSPAMHNAAYAHHRLPFAYLALPCGPRSWPQWPTWWRLMDLCGLNITAPFKERALTFVDRVDPVAARIGAVNTLVRRRGRWHGLNTDAAGFRRAVRSCLGDDARGRRVTILGAGGTAATLATCVLRDRCASLTIVNRSPRRAAALRRRLETHFPQQKIQLLTWSRRAMQRRAPSTDLLLQATSAPTHDRGALPWVSGDYPSHLAVFDVRYARPNPWLQSASAHTTLWSDGLEMLIEQAALSAEAWTQHKIDRSVLRKAALGHVGQL